MGWFKSYIRSSIGAKHVMAITGLMLIGFVLVHMLGNLQVFLGRDALNNYAASLKALGGLLWVARGGLVVIFLVHIYSAYRLVLMNKAARPVKYMKVKSERSTFSSRVMPWSGTIVLAFLAFHLVHFTLGGGPMAEQFNLLQDQGTAFERHDVYNMVVLSFQNPIVAISYCFAILLLCFHLKHGVTSLFQSLGLNHPKYNGIFNMAGPAIAALVLVGNCSMPIACLTGWVEATVKL